MTLTHHENITLIAADSDAAGTVEIHSMETVSYTHLDVYKRQVWK